jgi:UDP-N-acetylglucosamine 3-dehydrogenase
MVRIGVVGTGGWGKNHVRVLNELDSLGAVCDIDKTKVESYRVKYGVNGYTSFDEMISKEKLDGVTICTPATTHFKLASKSLSSGLHTFVEKPMTVSSDEGRKLIEIAKSSNRILTVGFIERFNPAISELNSIIKQRKLGNLILLEFHRENRRADTVTDVGIVKDASVHDIDTARWLFQEEPSLVFARVGNVKSEREDFAAIMLGFSGKKTAFLTTNWVTPNRVRTLSAVFEEGVVEVDFVTQQIKIHQQNGTQIPARQVQEPLMLELKEFISAIEEGREPLVTGKDGLMVTLIAEAVLASASSGAPIFLGGS